VRAGDPEIGSGDLAQQTLEHGDSGSGSDGPIGPAEDVGEIVSLGSDSHRVLSLLLFLLGINKSRSGSRGCGLWMIAGDPVNQAFIAPGAAVDNVVLLPQPAGWHRQGCG